MRYGDCTGATKTVRLSPQLKLYERYGNCKGAVESAQALWGLYVRYGDCAEDCTTGTQTTGAANIIRTLRKLYGRCGDCTETLRAPSVSCTNVSLASRGCQVNKDQYTHRGVK